MHGGSQVWLKHFYYILRVLLYQRDNTKREILCNSIKKAKSL